MTISFPGDSYPIANLPNTLLPRIPCLQTVLPSLLHQSPNQDWQTGGAGVVHPGPSLPATGQQARLGGARAATSIKPGSQEALWLYALPCHTACTGGQHKQGTQLGMKRGTCKILWVEFDCR